MPLVLKQLRAEYPCTCVVRSPLPALGLVPGDSFAYARRLDLFGLVEVVDMTADVQGVKLQLPAHAVRLTPAQADEPEIDAASAAAWEAFCEVDHTKVEKTAEG